MYIFKTSIARNILKNRQACCWRSGLLFFFCVELGFFFWWCGKWPGSKLSGINQKALVILQNFEVVFEKIYPNGLPPGSRRRGIRRSKGPTRCPADTRRRVGPANDGDADLPVLEQTGDHSYADVSKTDENFAVVLADQLKGESGFGRGLEKKFSLGNIVWVFCMDNARTADAL